MKIKEVKVTNKLNTALENEGFDYVGNTMNVLSLTKSGIERIDKNYFQYVQRKGKVFERAIEMFRSCKQEDFLKAYILVYEDSNSLLEFDYDYVGYNFFGYTTTKANMELLKDLLVKFEYCDSIEQEGQYFKEIEGTFFKIEEAW